MSGCSFHMPPHNTSVVPPTPSITHSCSTSVPISSMSLQLENTPCPLSPLPLASKGSDQFVDDISDIDDLDSDDDLQWLKKLSQCLGIWGGLACNKSDKI